MLWLEMNISIFILYFYQKFQVSYMYLTNAHTYAISYLLHLYNQFHDIPVIMT